MIKLKSAADCNEQWCGLISHRNAIVWTTDSGKLKLLECFAGYIFAVYEHVIYKIAVVLEFFFMQVKL